MRRICGAYASQSVDANSNKSRAAWTSVRKCAQRWITTAHNNLPTNPKYMIAVEHEHTVVTKGQHGHYHVLLWWGGGQNWVTGTVACPSEDIRISYTICIPLLKGTIFNPFRPQITLRPPCLTFRDWIPNFYFAKPGLFVVAQYFENIQLPFFTSNLSKNQRHK